MSKPSQTELRIARMAAGLGEIWVKHILDGQPFEPSEEFFLLAGFAKHAGLELLPESPGIYAIYVSEAIDFSFETASCLYVGQSLNMKKRIAGQHWNEGLRVVMQDFSSLGIFCRKQHKQGFSKEAFKKELYFAEYLMIGLLRPCFNFKGGKPFV